MDSSTRNSGLDRVVSRLVGRWGNTHFVGRRRPYGRVEFWRELRRLLKSNWQLVVGATLALVVCCWLFSLKIHGYRLGLIQASLAGMFVVAFTSLFLLYSGAGWKLVGAWGEDNTRDQLRKAERKDLVWGSIDTVKLKGVDIDHVVVTKCGVLVIDSKWHAKEQLSNWYLDKDAQAAKEGVSKVSSILRSTNFQKIDPDLPRELEVTPVIAIWGAGEGKFLEGISLHEGVVFLAGKNLQTWLSETYGQGPIRPATGRRIVKAIEQFATTSTTGKS
jgi:hypothetical protein